jgi:hypothetical protein
MFKLSFTQNHRGPGSGNTDKPVDLPEEPQPKNPGYDETDERPPKEKDPRKE